MYENVSVEDAIKRGQRMINYPVYVIMFGIIGLSYYLNTQSIIPGWVVGISVLVGFLAGWLYWSFRISKWKLWAFENVRNVHDLETKAIEAKLIWPEGSFWNKTEIWTSADKEKWVALQNKFDQKDIYEDDYTVPAETVIYYSRGAILVRMVLIMLCGVVGIYFLIEKNYIAGALLSIVGVWFSYSEYKKFLNKLPQIILNNKGIEIQLTGFTEWENIEDEKVISRSSGRTTTTYLEYLYPDGNVQLSIEELDITKKKLQNLLHTYRSRSRKQSS